MLQQRRNTLNRNINGIHKDLSFSANKTPDSSTISCQTNGGRLPYLSRAVYPQYLTLLWAIKNAPETISLTRDIIINIR